MSEFFGGLFTPDPGVVDGILAISVLYVLAVWPLRRHLAPDQPFEKWRMASYFTGVAILVLAVATPIDHIGETYLFSVHMLQHVILIFILPPFLILGLPHWLADFLLRTEGLGKVLSFLVKPVVACLLFNFMLVFWHIPAFYELALRDSFVHLAEHIGFVGSAILMYWPLLDPGKRETNTHNGIKLLYILGVSIGQLPLFAALTFSTVVFYPTYAAAPRILDLSPIDDQILGGATMKIAAVIYMFTGLCVYFYRWYQSEPRK
jgi:putative membrane protein